MDEDSCWRRATLHRSVGGIPHDGAFDDFIGGEWLGRALGNAGWCGDSSSRSFELKNVGDGDAVAVEVAGECLHED